MIDFNSFSTKSNLSSFNSEVIFDLLKNRSMVHVPLECSRFIYLTLQEFKDLYNDFLISYLFFKDGGLDV